MYNKNRKSLCFVMLKPWWAGNKMAIKYLLPNHYQWVSDFKYGLNPFLNNMVNLYGISIVFYFMHSNLFIYLALFADPEQGLAYLHVAWKNSFLKVDIFDYKWLHHDISQGDKMAAWKLFPCQMASISYRHFVKTMHSFCKRHSKKCLVLRVCHS